METKMDDESIDESVVVQDRYVRKAIETDSLSSKELVLRKKLIDQMHTISKLKDFPYIIDVEYLCVREGEIQAGQGDLLLTDGKGGFVAMELKSSFVCYDGSDRIFFAKTSKLLDQVRIYMNYQKYRHPNAKVYGCGVTEQKIYWFDADGTNQEFWWSSGPVSIESLRVPDTSDTFDTLPETLQELHCQFLEENLSKFYPFIIKHDEKKKRITYHSKCRSKRLTVCAEHIEQQQMDEIIVEYQRNGCSNGHILMFGMVKPSIITV